MEVSLYGQLSTIDNCIFANKVNIDLTTLQDTNVTTLLEAAQVKNVSEIDIAIAISILLVLMRDIEVESVLNSQHCWLRLKELLPFYIRELTQ